MAAISSASSICFLYDLIFCWSFSTRSVILSWFFLFSSCWNSSSLTRLDLLLELLHKVGDPVLVLLVFLLLEQQLLDTTLPLCDGLVHLVCVLDSPVQLHLDLVSPSLKFGGYLSRTTSHLERCLLCLSLHLG